MTDKTIAISCLGRNQGSLKLYHTTSKEIAQKILSTGFTDTCGDYGFKNIRGGPLSLSGVWFADRPLDDFDCDKSFADPIVLEVDVDPDVIEEFSLVEPGTHYREWLIPAKIVNRYPVIIVSNCPN